MQKVKALFLLLITISSFNASAQPKLEISGFSIAAPPPDHVDDFIDFINEVLVPNKINTLILRIGYNYEFKSHPELIDEDALSREQVGEIVATCRKNNIRLIPLFNLLGHQSWASAPNKLLQVYPEFDETPEVKMPEKYEWPNEDNLYCKSYCPLHPQVHQVIFDLVDELAEAFEAKDFHAGMDEVFYLASANCPRCKGKEPFELFAEEINLISDHLAEKGIRLWIWGDRLIEGIDSGIGIWEGSGNNTAPAIDMIPKSVVICDWHYEKAIPTPAYFALKGFDVIACSWRRPSVAIDQVALMAMLKQNSTPEMAAHYKGVIHTVWSGAGSFVVNYSNKQDSIIACFDAMVESMKALNGN